MKISYQINQLYQLTTVYMSEFVIKNKTKSKVARDSLCHSIKRDAYERLSFYKLSS